jgi:hypothetical protein
MDGLQSQQLLLGEASPSPSLVDEQDQFEGKPRETTQLVRGRRDMIRRMERLGMEVTLRGGGCSFWREDDSRGLPG